MHNHIAMYQSGEIELDISIQEETIWLTQKQIVELFDSSKANISEHIKAIFDSNELQRSATVRKFRTVQNEGGREVTRNMEHYNLDVVISVGYIFNASYNTNVAISYHTKESLVKSNISVSTPKR